MVLSTVRCSSCVRNKKEPCNFRWLRSFKQNWHIHCNSGHFIIQEAPHLHTFICYCHTYIFLYSHFLCFWWREQVNSCSSYAVCLDVWREGNDQERVLVWRLLSIYHHNNLLTSLTIAAQSQERQWQLPELQESHWMLQWCSHCPLMDQCLLVFDSHPWMVDHKLWHMWWNQ